MQAEEASRLVWENKVETNIKNGFDVDNNSSRSKISKFTQNTDCDIWTNPALSRAFCISVLIICASSRPHFLHILCAGGLPFQVWFVLRLFSDIGPEERGVGLSFCNRVGFLESNFSNFRPLGISQHPTLVWFRNLKGRNIRPYPIKLWRICVHQEKSGFVIYVCDIVLNRQAYGQTDREQTSSTGLV